MGYREDAKEALRADLKAHREILGRLDDQAKTTITARNVLHEDLGYFKGMPTDYDLDALIRDRLLAHARQDASHAVMNTIYLMGYQKWNRRLILACFAVLIYIAWKVS